MAKKHNWQKRGKSATLHVCIGTDYKGRPKRYTKTIPYTTDAKVDREWERFYQECADGKQSKTKNMTISDMTELVMKDVAKPHLKRSTVCGYKSCQKVVDSALGDLKIDKVKPIHIQQWVNDMATRLSPKTVLNYYSFLKSCFKSLEEWELIADNPCKHIKLPKKEKKEVKIMHEDDMNRFLSELFALSDECADKKVAILLSLFGGLRRGEVCGIEESNIDFNAGYILIENALYVDEDGLYEDTPKSKSSIRKVYYPDEVMKEVRHLILLHKEQQLQLGTKWQGSTKLIKGPFGKDVYPSTLYEFLNKFLKEHGFEHISFHALRHTYTAMLVDMEKPISEISKSLGHAQQSTTMNIYSHMFKRPDQAKKETANELSEQFLQQIYNKAK